MWPCPIHGNFLDVLQAIWGGRFDKQFQACTAVERQDMALPCYTHGQWHALLLACLWQHVSQGLLRLKSHHFPGVCEAATL